VRWQGRLEVEAPPARPAWIGVLTYPIVEHEGIADRSMKDARTSQQVRRS
jgi:hypothetical protein